MRNDKVYKIIIKLSVSERKRERDSLLQQNKLHQLFTKSTGHSTTQMKKKWIQSLLSPFFSLQVHAAIIINLGIFGRPFFGV